MSTSNTNKIVEPFMYGNHLHYEGMPECETCEDDNTAWEAITERYHAYELAKKITKTRAWKAYRQAKPFDDYEPVLSLDVMMANGFVIADDRDVMEEVIIREDLAEFRTRLTPKQLSVLERLGQGYTSKDITIEEGYKNTGGVRYHRHVLRRKYRDFNEN